ncbi:putative UPF0481 protein At3g02645 [Corylus avellana]|uniref:putative UPF0481 protein At3g02645 n=1 Tax=Corylus avellana TaxID=13451 RepID=UPI001E22F33A|nr:putative UPF0481 protein At3g02645 [Corylus avellana]
MSSQFDPKFDELQWVIQIRRTLEEDQLDDQEYSGKLPVCIFNVPKVLLSTHPDSYTPQQVSLGPYHYWRSELFEMERYKLAAAKTTQKHFQTLKFHNLVDQLIKVEPRIRACYHKYLHFNGETLAWMMAIDASFLLQFLQFYSTKEGIRASSRMSHLVDNAILRDMIMLENQIPLFVLRKILEFQFSSPESANDTLFSILIGFCKELSPFKLIIIMEASESAHLLDLLYNMIVPKIEEPSEIIELDVHGKETSSADSSSYVKKLLHEIWKLISKLNRGPVRFIKQVIISKAVKFILKFPLTILSNLPGFAMLKQPVEYLFFSQDREESRPENDVSRPPLVEEITIPSVTELTRAGFRFAPTNGGVSTVSFDVKTSTFYLPTVTLDVNTEVVLRNLVAYEASNASGPLVFTRYTELMNGIIDTENDVKALRERGIILNRLKSDGEVASLWNGMSKSIRLTKVPFLDKVIEDVNKYYSGKWRVKVGILLKVYVFEPWQFLALLAAILVLLLMTLQAFCSIYINTRVLPVKRTQ